MYEKVLPNGKVGVYSDTTNNLLYYKPSERSQRLKELKDRIEDEIFRREQRWLSLAAKAQKDWEEQGYPGLEEWL